MRILHRLLPALVLTALAAAAGTVPRQVKPLKVVSYDGRSVDLEDLKGKVVVLKFFSTTCPHCQNASLAIGPIYEELKAKGLEVVGLALNEVGPAELRAFAAAYKGSYPMAVSSRGEFARMAEMSVMARFYYPYMLFIDRRGRVREEHQGSERMWMDSVGPNFRALVSKLLAE